MHSYSKLGVIVAVFALSAIIVASASAATFTASATGTLSGSALQTQTFTTNAGQVKCTTAKVTGNIVSTASPEQKVKIEKSGCTAFGFANVHISPEEYNFTADGTVHILNTITINVTPGACHQTIHPQTVGTITWVVNGLGLVAQPNVSNIAYTSTGGLCSTGGLNGTYTGNIAISRVGGGSFTRDP